MKKNKNSYEEVLEAEVAKLKEENRHLKDERDELKYMLNDSIVLLMLQMMTFSMKCQDCAVVLKSKVQESQQHIRI